MPLVSVVIPTRDRPALLADAVRSVLDQDFRDYEIIVVDDGSEHAEDNARVLAELAGSIRYIRRDRPGGQSAARNTGIAASDSQYVAFLDDDDLWHPSKLGKQVAVFEIPGTSSHQLGVVYCGHQWIDMATSRVQSRWMPDLQTIDDLLRLRYNIVQTMLIRRDCLTAVGGFDDTLAFLENLELLGRLIQRYAFAGVAETLVVCRNHGGIRTVDNRRAVIAGHREILRRFGQAVRDRTTLQKEYYRLGRSLMVVGDMAEARRSLREAIRLAAWPLKLQYAFFLGLTFVTKTSRASYRSYIAPAVRTVRRR